MLKIFVYLNLCFLEGLEWPKSLMSIFCRKTDNLSKIAIY